MHFCERSAPEQKESACRFIMEQVHKLEPRKSALDQDFDDDADEAAAQAAKQVSHTHFCKDGWLSGGCRLKVSPLRGL